MDEGPGVQLPSSAALLNVHLLKEPLTTRGDLGDDDDRGDEDDLDDYDDCGDDDDLDDDDDRGDDNDHGDWD